MLSFIKYQSLGNDFILLDWMEEEHSLPDNWSSFVSKICERRFGIGADGVLMLKKTDQGKPECLIFNADGSLSERCLNSVRCAVDYLYTQKKYSAKLEIRMGCDFIQGEMQENKKIKLTIQDAKYIQPLVINIATIDLPGHVVNVGVPHFIVLKEVSGEWLRAQGSAIEHHAAFPNKTNVDFLWETERNNTRRNFNLLVHERGCGMTLSCGSGAAAAMKTLLQLQKIKCNEKINLTAPGGVLETYVDGHGDIIQIAGAEMVYVGELSIRSPYSATLHTVSGSPPSRG